jgi:hypothetical protein
MLGAKNYESVRIARPRLLLDRTPLPDRRHGGAASWGSGVMGERRHGGAASWGSGVAAVSQPPDARMGGRLPGTDGWARQEQLGSPGVEPPAVAGAFPLECRSEAAYNSERFPEIGRFMMGRSQVVRQRILIPPCGGSNPPAPASHASHIFPYLPKTQYLATS